MKLSLVIPAQNEAKSIGHTLRQLCAELDSQRIDYEALVVDDASSDGTPDVVNEVARENVRVRLHRSHLPPGFGHAVRAGLDVFTGDAVAIYMADASDSARDVVRYHRLLDEGWDCVFGSRFMRGSVVRDYPRVKLVINRVVNWGIQLLFGHGYNDTTNAFKAYRREVIEQCRPFLSNHFNLTVELPLKAFTRGFSFAVVPISWTNRAAGESKLALQEMGSRYLFIVLYVFLEHHLSRGDYWRAELPGRPRGRRRMPHRRRPATPESSTRA